MRFASKRARADALEVLSNLGDREASHLLVAMLEEGSIEERIPAVAPFLEIPQSGEEVRRAAAQARDPWLRLAAAADHTVEQEEDMERLVVLRQVALFAELPLDQLEAVNQLMKEAKYLRGEVICHQGELASELYVLIEGQVRFYKFYGTDAEQYLGDQDPPGYTGEMGLLANMERSATIVAAKDTTLLTLDGEQLKDLILQVPDIAFKLFRVLAERVQKAETELHHMIDSAAS